MGLDNLVGINRVGLYKEPKVLQVNAQLAQKGECWTWGERRSEVQVQLSLRVTCCYWSFCFHVVKPLMPTLASLPMLCLCEDPDYNKEPTVIWRHRKASYSLQSPLIGSSRIQLIHQKKMNPIQNRKKTRMHFEIIYNSLIWHCVSLVSCYNGPQSSFSVMKLSQIFQISQIIKIPVVSKEATYSFLCDYRRPITTG